MQAEESREEILAYFRKHSNCELPYCIELVADKAGEHVVVVGGTHGNEPAKNEKWKMAASAVLEAGCLSVKA